MYIYLFIYIRTYILFFFMIGASIVYFQSIFVLFLFPRVTLMGGLILRSFDLVRIPSPSPFFLFVCTVFVFLLLTVSSLSLFFRRWLSRSSIRPNWIREACKRWDDCSFWMLHFDFLSFLSRQNARTRKQRILTCTRARLVTWSLANLERVASSNQVKNKSTRVTRIKSSGLFLLLLASLNNEMGSWTSSFRCIWFVDFVVHMLS